MSTASPSAQASHRGKRADALRNEQTLLAAAAAVFVASGVDAPIREIATAAGRRDRDDLPALPDPG